MASFIENIVSEKRDKMDKVFSKQEQAMILETALMHLTNIDDFAEMSEYLDVSEDELEVLKDKIATVLA